MNKFKLVIGIALIALLGACANTEPEAVVAPEAAPEAPATPAVVESERTTTTTTTTTKNADGTEVKVTTEGIEVGTRKGGNATEIKVTTDSISFKKK